MVNIGKIVESWPQFEKTQHHPQLSHMHHPQLSHMHDIHCAEFESGDERFPDKLEVFECNDILYLTLEGCMDINEFEKRMTENGINGETTKYDGQDYWSTLITLSDPEMVSKIHRAINSAIPILEEMAYTG